MHENQRLATALVNVVEVVLVHPVESTLYFVTHFLNSFAERMHA